MRSATIRDPAHSIARLSQRFPRAAIVIPLLLTALAAPGLLRLSLRTDGAALIPEQEPGVLTDREVRGEFGIHDQMIVAIWTGEPDGIFDLEVSKAIVGLTEDLAGIDERPPVRSLATERRDRVYPGTLRFRPFLDPLPDTPARMAQYRDDVLAVDLLRGTFVSADYGATAILVGVPEEIEDRTAFYAEVMARVEPYRVDGLEIAVVGAPAAETLLGIHILEDLALILPLCIAVMAAILWVGCRRLWGVALGMAEVGACLLFTFGIMGWVGVPLYLTTAVLPAVLTTIGLADEIHLFWRYQQLLDEAEKPVTRLMGDLVRPITLTSLTTGIGFLSFLSSPLEAVRAFGWFAPLGIGFCLLWSLTVIPAALSLLPDEKLRRPRRAPPMMRIGGRGLSIVRAVLLVVLVVAVGSGVDRLVVQDSWVDGFAPGSPFRRATDRVNESFYGTHLLRFSLTFPPLDEPLESVYHGEPGPLLVPETLLGLGELERFIGDWERVGGVQGLHGNLVTTAFLRSGRREDRRKIPDNPPEVAVVVNRLEEVRGRSERRKLVDDARRTCLTTVFLKNANYRDTEALMRAIEARVAESFPEAELRFAGDVAVSQAMIPVIVESQVRSLLLALGGALLVLMIALRRPVLALVVMTPTAAAVIATFGLMGWTGMPLGVATSMFCAITLGIGVDYSLHFAAAFGRATKAGRADPAASARVEVGPAIIADTLAIAFGFGLLVFSSVPANARLGILVAFGLFANAMLTLEGLGFLLRAGGGGGVGVSPTIEPAPEKPFPDVN